jgi:hypothetical protein
MKSSYYGSIWYNYLALLERTTVPKPGDPERVIKVGITNARDPMSRLLFRREDEPYPITNYFSKIEFIKLREFKTEYEAERNERKIMGMVKKQFSSPRFHDWKENDLISGITEMRTWRDNEVNYMISIM